KAGKIPTEREESVLTLIAALAGPKELAMVFDLAVKDEKTSAGRRLSLLTALEQAAQQRRVKPEGDLDRIGKLLRSEIPIISAAAARLARHWKMEAFRGELLKLAGDLGTDFAPREAAFEGLTLLGGEPSRKAFEELAAKRDYVEVSRHAVVALAKMDVTAAAKHAV